MKICIDTFGCDHGKSHAGKYLVSILKELPAIELGGDVEFELFGPESDRYDYETGDDVKYVPVDLPDNPLSVKFWYAFGCNAFFSRQKFDAVVFLSEAHLPLRCRIPTVVVVNDVLSLRLFSLPFSTRTRIRWSLSQVGKIVVPSQFVKKDLRRLRLNQEKIAVIHNGIDHSVFYPRGGSDLDSGVVDIKPFAIQKPYFIYASKMSSPLKKHRELVRAFSDFKERTGKPHRLVLAGGEGEFSDAVSKAVMESQFASDIFITGYFPHETYPELYANSSGCIFPSVCEGVGMSVLEAMSMGVPVICAKSGAIPEATGENAIYFDGNSEQELSAAIERLVGEDESVRRKMVADGLEWAARFNWRKTTEELLAVICAVAKKKK